MYHLLLTGAGFSYNWGGFLANEAFEYLLAVTEGDDDLRSRLWHDHDSHFGFEDSLAALQASFAKKFDPQVEQDLRNLYSALQRMFGDMARAFNDTPFEPLDRPVSRFLGQFDAIFTLNQDTLLETHYLSRAEPAVFDLRPPFVPPLTSAYRPGVVETNDFSDYGPMGTVRLWQPNESDLAVAPGEQPYFKLHGSIDIKGGDREMMLILGGDKIANIAKHPLLRFYHREFLRMICTPNSRLMIIGYSFGDSHINRMLAQGVKAGLKLFVIDPQGVDALSQHVLRLRFNPGFAMKNAVVGASRRPFRSTLRGEDQVELMKVQRFFRYIPAGLAHVSPVAVPPTRTGDAQRKTPQRRRKSRR